MSNYQGEAMTTELEATLAEVTRQRDLNRATLYGIRELTVVAPGFGGRNDGDCISLPARELMALLNIDDGPVTEGDHARADEVFAYVYNDGPGPVTIPGRGDQHQ